MDFVSVVAGQLHEHFIELSDVEFADLVDAEVECRRGGAADR